MTDEIATLSPRDQTPVTATHHQGDTTTATLYRFISTLDADVHITLDGTDDIDGPSFAAPETLPIGGGTDDPDEDTKLVTDGSSTTQVESALLTEGWPWLEFSVTAQTTPTAGSVELRAVEDF